MGGKSTGLVLTASHHASFGTASKLINELVRQQTTVGLSPVHLHHERGVIRALNLLRQFLVAHALCIKPNEVSLDVGHGGVKLCSPKVVPQGACWC